MNGPHVDGSVVLYGPQLPVLFLYEEEGSGIGALQQSYRPLSEVLFEEPFELLLLELGQVNVSADEGGWCSFFQVYGVVPWSLWWEPL